MTRLITFLKAVDLTDLALVSGGVLLWIGLSMLTDWAPFVVIGVLLLLYGAAPMLLTGGRRK